VLTNDSANCAGGDGEGDTQQVQGTGMGEGDTRGAKDVSDKIDNEDQLLGAQQKDKQEEEEKQHEQDEGQEDNEDKVGWRAELHAAVHRHSLLEGIRRIRGRRKMKARWGGVLSCKLLCIDTACLKA